MPIKNLNEKMMYELGIILDAENRFLEAQQTLLPKATSEQVKSMLQKHVTETEQQIRNLEQIFSAMGTQPKRQNCDTATSLVNDAQKLLREVGDKPELCDTVIVGGQAKIEHFEIACYQSLIAGAELTGQQDAVRLLQQNLQQEEQTAQLIQKNLPKLLQQAMQSERSAV